MSIAPYYLRVLATASPDAIHQPEIIAAIRRALEETADEIERLGEELESLRQASGHRDH